MQFLPIGHDLVFKYLLVPGCIAISCVTKFISWLVWSLKARIGFYWFLSYCIVPKISDYEIKSFIPTEKLAFLHIHECID